VSARPHTAASRFGMSEQREVRQMIMVIRHRREWTLGASRSMTPARRSISYVTSALQGTSVSKAEFDVCGRGRKVYRDGIGRQGHLTTLPRSAERPATASAPKSNLQATNVETTNNVETSSAFTTGRISAGLSTPSTAGLPINTSLPINIAVPANLSVPSSVSPRSTKGPLSGVPAWSPPVL
jgi:hypothetical protein